MLARADALVGEARRHMESFALHLYIGAVFEAVSEANRYFANAEPWRLAKTDPARMGLVLFVTIETLRIAAILLQPVMPGSMGALLDLLSVAPEARAFAASTPATAAGRLDAPHRLEPGRALPAPAPVFPRYVERGGEVRRRTPSPQPSPAERERGARPFSLGEKVAAKRPDEGPAAA